ncbi:MAG: hypothetical protein ACRCYS_17265 [Beijerinckiaceae bacterium]
MRFICGYQSAHDGVSPSFEEMCVGINSASKSSIGRLLAQLAVDGRIRVMLNRARAIEVLHPVPVPYAPDGAPLYAVRLP